MLTNYDSYKSILPPHWCKEGEIYINELTLERTNEPPIDKYIASRNLYINDETPKQLNMNTTEPAQMKTFDTEDENKNVTELTNCLKYYEFHCQVFSIFLKFKFLYTRLINIFSIFTLKKVD